MTPFFNIAGGLRYHLRARNNASHLWRPFRSALSEWLTAWQIPKKRLLIVGASGGYCLDPNWLRTFQELICLDPDPLAQILFRHRLLKDAEGAAPRLSWSTENILKLRDPASQMAQFKEFLKKYPDSPVLFSNILGQLGLLLDEAGCNPTEAIQYWKTHLLECLEGRPWASFHDRVSGPLRPSFMQPCAFPQRLRNQEVIAQLYPRLHQRAELIDHDTEGFFPERLEHTYFYWRLVPGTVHVIEGVRI